MNDISSTLKHKLIAKCIGWCSSVVFESVSNGESVHWKQRWIVYKSDTFKQPNISL